MSTLEAYNDEFGGHHEYTGDVQYTGGYHEYTRVYHEFGGYHEYTGDVKYTGGYHEYTRVYHECGDIMSTLGMFNTLGDSMSTLGFTMSVGVIMSTLGVFSTPESYHEYTGGYQDACGGYHEYTGGVQYTRGLSWVHWWDTKMHVGVIMSTLGGVQYTGRIPWVHREGGVQYTGAFWYEWEKTATKFPGLLFSYFLLLCSCICWPLEHQTAL